MFRKGVPINVTKALPLDSCIAKTYHQTKEEMVCGRTVLNHCQIVGQIAREILGRYPDFVKEALFPEGSELVAASHDVGKVSPYFQEKLYRNISGYQFNSLEPLRHVQDPSLEKAWGGHAGVSLVAAQSEKVGKFIPEVIGQHHGFSPQLGGKIAEDEVFGGEVWQERRGELLAELKKQLDAEWPEIETLLQARAIAGLTTVSDWIGSGSFFENPNSDWKSAISKAVNYAGFVKPKIIPDLSFQNLFGFSPRAIQSELFESVTQPGVYILEAPMGLGKTEAALYAAYQALSLKSATGIYFALPTQLTSNKIHTRVNQFLENILVPGCSHRRALLLHGNAWLTETEMGEEGKPGGSWFMSGKRGILAPFAVGTIDQALMAVMNVKHGFVRTFGLAGKVVILDEVHSYDAYTGTLLDELVTALRALQCTVIILSATLTMERRSALIENNVSQSAYPLISTSVTGQPSKEIPVAAQPDQTVSLIRGDDDSAVNEVLRRAEAGQQILWIENTVNEAQSIFSRLASRMTEMEADCGLLHSRFTRVDRDRSEAQWVSLYGKSGREHRTERGRILVGTQVLEQSLDIDADFMVTRFCPTDMLLQRLGRLWRHQENDDARPQTALREAWLIMPELKRATANPDHAFDRTAFVYSPYVLCRSLEVWDQLDSIAIPGDVRQCIEDTYKDRIETESMARWKEELLNGNSKKQRVGVNAMRGMAQIGLSTGGQTLPENKATTRYSEQESVQVLLFKKITTTDNGIMLTLHSGDQLEIPEGVKYLDKQQWRKLAVEIMRHVVNVAKHLAPRPISKKSISWLADYLYLGHLESESLVRVGIVKESDEIVLPDGGSSSDQYYLSYNNHLGYCTKKRGE